MLIVKLGISLNRSLFQALRQVCLKLEVTLDNVGNG